MRKRWYGDREKVWCEDLHACQSGFGFIEHVTCNKLIGRPSQCPVKFTVQNVQQNGKVSSWHVGAELSTR